MKDDVNTQTEAATENKAAEEGPEQAVLGLIDQIRPYAVCYIISAIPIAVGGFIGLGSDHWKLGLLFTGIGITLVLAGLTLQFRARKPRKERLWRINWSVVGIFLIPPVASFVLFRGMYELGRWRSEVAYEKGREDTRLARIPPAPTHATVRLPNGRIVLTDVVPEYLEVLLREHTNPEAMRLIEPYWDKWIFFEGTVGDVRNFPKEYNLTTLWIEREGLYSFGRHTGVHFKDPQQIERLQVLKKGNPVAVFCRIGRENDGFDLTDCELQ